MIENLTIKIYRSEQCGYKYDIYDQDELDKNEDAEPLDGGHCTSDIINALQMADGQARDILLSESNNEHAKNIAIYNSLSPNDREEVDQRISDSQQSDADAKEAGDDYWEATDRQYLAWALEELEANRK